jgi:hypothetical protein
MDIINPLAHYEKLVELYEEGKIRLDNEELIELADKIIGFKGDLDEPTWIDWFHNLSYKYQKGCEKSRSPPPCRKCQKLCTDSCDFTKSMGLADYIYRNLVTNLPEIYKTLDAFIIDKIIA